MTAERPAKEDVIAALERVLASETFARSDRARKLLDYLVRTEIAGRADRLKGFAVAVDVFGKDADFDPATDAVVRVQAGRLRELLDQHYAGAGATEKWRIVVPRGTYVPVYRAGADVSADAGDPGQTPTTVVLDQARISAAIDARFGPEAPAPPLATMPRGRGDVVPPSFVRTVSRHVQWFRLGLVFIIALLGFVAWRVATVPGEGVAVDSAASIRMRGSRGAATAAQLPSVRLIDESGSDAGRRAFDALRAALPAFDAINFVGTGPTAAHAPVPDAYLARVLATQSPSTALVQIEHMESGKVIFAQPLDIGAGFDQSGNGLSALMTAAFPVSGALYAHVAENDLTSSLTECLVLENRFFLDLREDEHAAAYGCFDGLAGKGAKSPLVWAELANLQVAAVTGKFANPAGASLDNALQFARKAVELGPSNATAYRAQGFILARSGDIDSGIRWTLKAAALNPHDMSLAASAGNTLVLAGDYAAGAKLLDMAAAANPVHPHWWDYARFLGHLMTGAGEPAWAAADALVDSDRRHYLAARLVAAVGRNEMIEARAIAGKLATASPEFIADPLAAFAEAHYPGDLAETFAKALKAALAASGAS